MPQSPKIPLADFEQVAAGQWVQPRRKGYRMACCDCGLIHTMDFRIVKYGKKRRSKVQFRAFREEPDK